MSSFQRLQEWYIVLGVGKGVHFRVVSSVLVYRDCTHTILIATHAHSPTHSPPSTNPPPPHLTHTQLRLEEKQRAKRRQGEEAAARAAQAAAEGNQEEASRLEQAATYSPHWFRKEFDPVTSSMMHVFRGGYWEGKNSGWEGVEFPDIF